MQRFLAVGRARLHVLEAGVHDPREATRIVATLASLRPKRLWLDISGEEWAAVVRRRPLHGLDKRILAVAAKAGTTDAECVYRAAREWADANGVVVQFLLDKTERPRRLDLWRLDRLLRREGFEAADPTAAARRLHLQYVSRVRGLVRWLDRRWTQAAERLAAAEQGAGAGGIVLCATPDGQEIADRAQRLIR